MPPQPVQNRIDRRSCRAVQGWTPAFAGVTKGSARAPGGRGARRTLRGPVGGCHVLSCSSCRRRISICPFRHGRTPPFVMPGLVPGIHFRRRNGPDGDARNKSGHDGKRAGAAAAGSLPRARNAGARARGRLPSSPRPPPVPAPERGPSLTPFAAAAGEERDRPSRPAARTGAGPRLGGRGDGGA